MGKKTKKEFSEAVCHKNDELTLEIIDMGTEGEGIGRANGYALFVQGRIGWRYCPSTGNENEKAFWICAFVRNYTAVAVPRGTEMSGGKTLRWMPVAALQL